MTKEQKNEYMRQWRQKRLLSMTEEEKEQEKAKQREYQAKYMQNNKDKVYERQRKYREEHREEVNAKAREYHIAHPESNKKSHENFIKKNDWVKYCAERRKARVERLRSEGCTNAWSVINGAEPKYKKAEEV